MFRSVEAVDKKHCRSVCVDLSSHQPVLSICGCTVPCPITLIRIDEIRFEMSSIPREYNWRSALSLQEKNAFFNSESIELSDSDEEA